MKNYLLKNLKNFSQIKMIVKYKKAFIKDIKKLPSDVRYIIENLCLSEIPKIQSIAQIKNRKKIKGYENLCRLKIKDYRIGIEIRNEDVVFVRVLHRKEIYRYFPGS